jgi:hypothetical protein
LSQIALLLDCSHRTAAEDLDLLRDNGIEVIWTAAGYRIAGSSADMRTMERDALRLTPSSKRTSLTRGELPRRHPLRWSLSRPPSTI